MSCSLIDDKNKDCAATEAYRYLNNRNEQLDYKGALEEELPIGSGLIRKWTPPCITIEDEDTWSFLAPRKCEKNVAITGASKEWRMGRLLAAKFFQTCCLKLPRTFNYTL